MSHEAERRLNVRVGAEDADGAALLSWAAPAAGCAGGRGSRPYSENGSLCPISRANSASGSLAGAGGVGSWPNGSFDRLRALLLSAIDIRFQVSAAPLAVPGIGLKTSEGPRLPHLVRRFYP